AAWPPPSLSLPRPRPPTSPLFPYTTLFRSGVARILHAGDVNARSTLDELARIAPVDAVRGDHDEALSELPLTRELTVDGKRIVVVHGNRSRWVEEPHTLLWTLSLGVFRAHFDLPRSLRR